MKLSTFRRITQAITGSLFVVFFLFTVYPFPNSFPVDIFLRLDPLVAIVTMIASHAFILKIAIAGMIIIILTIILGRFFCGYMCPLGTLIDITNFLFFRKHFKYETPDPKPNQNVKYFILIGVVFASLLGANLLHFFSPMSITPRFFTFVVFPPIIWFLNFIIDIFRPLFIAIGLDSIGQFSYYKPHFSGAFITLLFMTIILGANFWRKRFWCRYICPTGALLSIFSRFGIFKIYSSSKHCNNCRDCASACDMRAIPADSTKTILGECTLCGKCIDACDGSTVLQTTPLGFGNHLHALNVERRKFIYSGLAGIALASSIKAGLQNKKNINGMYIRPPGSVPEKDFLAQCIRCGECMKVCKTNTIQPSGLAEAGFDGMWTPHLLMRIGACEEKCNACGQVCPTQAIRKLPMIEKSYVKIGTAIIDRRRCVAWAQRKTCLICDEICPYDAIISKSKKPVVIEEKCTGCGWCENKCPTAGRGAIEVFSIGEDRIKKGSYITTKREKLREISDENVSNEAAAFNQKNHKIKSVEQQLPTPNKQAEEPLPKGFSFD